MRCPECNFEDPDYAIVHIHWRWQHAVRVLTIELEDGQRLSFESTEDPPDAAPSPQSSG